MTANKVTAPNCRQVLQFGCAGFFGRCIRWQRPFPAAVGDLVVRLGTPYT